MTRRLPDVALMLVTDAAMTAARGLVATVLAAVEGGATMVQLRDKTAPDLVLVEVAQALKSRLAPLGVPLIVNDRVAVARAAQADGVHLGQTDGDPAAARAVMGPDALIGLSVSSSDEAAAVDPKLVDYAGLGPVFATPTKPDAGLPLGLEGVRRLRSLLPLPALAIGGIDRNNAQAVVSAGADGIAVVSAICAASDPRAATAELRRAIVEGRRR
ncbi:MAG: thiamine phosphate synthase [Pseudomonadota bacterium]